MTVMLAYELARRWRENRLAEGTLSVIREINMPLDAILQKSRKLMKQYDNDFAKAFLQISAQLESEIVEVARKRLPEHGRGEAPELVRELEAKQLVSRSFSRAFTLVWRLRNRVNKAKSVSSTESVRGVHLEVALLQYLQRKYPAQSTQSRQV